MTGGSLPASAPGTAGSAAYGRLHDDALRCLGDWAAPDDAQEGLRQQFVAHLRAHPDAMAKSGPPAHLTASVIVLDPAGSRVLLTLHRRAREWFQLGGHYEPGDDTVWAAAAREAAEESGVAGIRVLPEIVHLDRHVLVGDFGRCREHLDIRFAAVAPVGSEPAVSSESLDVRWWTVDALPAGTRDDLTPLVEAALRVVRT